MTRPTHIGKVERIYFSAKVKDHRLVVTSQRRMDADLSISTPNVNKRTLAKADLDSQALAVSYYTNNPDFVMITKKGNCVSIPDTLVDMVVNALTKYRDSMEKRYLEYAKWQDEKNGVP